MRSLVLAALLLVSVPAYAHIVASPNTAESGAWFRTALRVGHGCNGSDTTQITVTVPKDILIIKPQVKPGWTVSVHKVALKKPVQGPHGTITEVTRTITWTGILSDDYFDEFGLSMKLPEKTGTLIFPTKQECAEGEINWTETPMPNDHHHSHGAPSFPAPIITLTPTTAK